MTWAAIVLAAGRSRRMGPTNKLTATWRGTPLVSHVVDNLRAAGARLILVVTGYEAQEIREALGERDVCWVHNPRHEEGMGTSLGAGVRALPEGVVCVAVCLGDMPGISVETMRVLSASWRPGTIVRPRFEGKVGHPVLFGAEFFPELEVLGGDRGARDVLKRHASCCVFVDVDDAYVVLDVDTPEAFANLRKKGVSPT